MQLKINLIIILTFSLISCTFDNQNKLSNNYLEKKEESTTTEVNETIIKSEDTNIVIEEKKIIVQKTKITKKTNTNTQMYFVGEPYFIDGVKYTPEEDYSYSQTGLASYYDKELHRKKTINNEYNKVTELFARHKTLPLPSIVKITNLENGLSINVRVNDRGPMNNTRIIEVSRKVAQLLRFYKSKIAKVRIEILSDPSKQLKIVSKSISNPEFNKTIKSAPTEEVTISDLGETPELIDNEIEADYEQPIKLGLEKIVKSDLFVKISGFNSYQDAKNLINTIQEPYKITIQKEKNEYSIIFGPILNKDIDNLFQILVSKGYKKSEIIIR